MGFSTTYLCLYTDAGLMVAVVIGVVLGILVGAFMLVTVFIFRQRSLLFDAICCLAV